MFTSMDQKAYLQKYLGGPSNEKKKKKKKVIKGKGFKIIDDDIDLSKLKPLDGDDLDIYGEGEDAPQIAGIIDDRPEEVKKLEQFQTTSKWKVINQDDGFNSKLQIEEIKRDVKETQKETELMFGKMYSDSEDEKKNESDATPPRKQSGNENKSKTSSKKSQNSDSDFSPPRKRNDESPQRKKTKQDYDSDLSPPRLHSEPSHKTKERRKPSRWDKEDGNKNRSKSYSPKRSKTRRSPLFYKLSQESDSDASPPRKSPNKKDSHSKKSRKNNDDTDESLPRKSHKRRDSPDSDPSPPRKRKSSMDRHNNVKNKRSLSSKHRRTPDSDSSPPRKKSSSGRSQRSASPRKSRKHSPEKSKRKHDSDSDLSPPRKEKYSKKDDRHKADSPPPSNKKMASKTLEGKKAGLQDAVQLRQENEAFRRREDEAFSRLADDLSGRTAHVVSRKAKRETSEDRKKQKDKAEKQKELDEKYKKWGKGLKQLEEQETRVQEFLHEAAKPLARHRNDRDLESSLKQVERAGDPMLQYIRERKRERGELPPEKPSYKGNFPPNRFNIRPGYRWDGVDRSNGYEKKFFDQQSKRKAQEEEAYKWSTEDL